MRTTLCTLAFLLSIPWSLNGHLTTRQKNIEITTRGEDASEQSDYTIDSGVKNVVSLSARVQTLHLTSHIEKQRIKRSFRLHTTSPMQTDVSTKTANATRADVSPVEKGSSGLSEGSIQLTTLQKKEGQSSHKPHTTSLQTENASESNVWTKIPSATGPDEKRTSKRLFRSFQTQDFTTHLKKRGISLSTMNSEDQTSLQRTKRSLSDDSKHNSTTVESQTTQEELTTQKEQHKPTESSHKPNTKYVFWIETSSEFDVSTKPSSTTRVKEVKTSRGPSLTQETTQETPSISIGPYDAQATGNTNGELNTTHPTMETTDQPGPMTHGHNSSAITATTDLNKTVSTSGLKTTEREDVKWTSTQGPKLRTSTMTSSTKKMLTTNKPNKSNPPEKDGQKLNPGPAVAALIGTTFFLMFIAIICILAKKRKMQKRQQENPEWAGPSPFLDGEVQPNLTNMDNTEGINRQGFSQMPIGRYLPSRLSKHLTLGRNTSEEVLMGDIMQGSTFGRQAADEVQAPNGKPNFSQDPTESEQSQVEKDQTPVDSSDTKTNASESEPVMESKESKQTEDVTAPLPSDKATKIKHAPPLVSIDLDSLSEEAAPFQTSDGGIAPPAPPLP